MFNTATCGRGTTGDAEAAGGSGVDGLASDMVSEPRRRDGVDGDGGTAGGALLGDVRDAGGPLPSPG